MGSPSKLADIDADVIDTLIDFDKSQVGQAVGSYINDFSGQMIRAVLVGETPDFESALDDAAESMQRNLYNDTRTAVLSFERTITVKKALDSGFELFLYIGPDDDVTREFCADILDNDPPIFTADEIAAMDNGQGLDVFTACGGYNCRHSWNPVSLERAIELGYEADNGD